MTGCCVGEVGARLSSFGPPFGVLGAEVPWPFPDPGPPIAAPSSAGALASGVADDGGVGSGFTLEAVEPCFGRSTLGRLLSCCIMSKIRVLLGTLKIGADSEGVTSDI